MIVLTERLLVELRGRLMVLLIAMMVFILCNEYELRGLFWLEYIASSDSWLQIFGRGCSLVVFWIWSYGAAFSVLWSLWIALKMKLKSRVQNWESVSRFGSMVFQMYVAILGLLGFEMISHPDAHQFNYHDDMFVGFLFFELVKRLLILGCLNWLVCRPLLMFVLRDEANE